jgi:hypothetical protein
MERRARGFLMRTRVRFSGRRRNRRDNKEILMTKKKKKISFRLPMDDLEAMERFESETGAIRIPLDPDPETLRHVRLQILTSMVDRGRPITFGDMEEILELAIEATPDGIFRLRPGVEWPVRADKCRRPKGDSHED